MEAPLDGLPARTVRQLPQPKLSDICIHFSDRPFTFEVSEICIQTSDKADWSLEVRRVKKAQETERFRTGAAQAAVSNQFRKSSLPPSQLEPSPQLLHNWQPNDCQVLDHSFRDQAVGIVGGASPL